MAAGQSPFGGSNQWGSFPTLNTNFISSFGADGFNPSSGGTNMFGQPSQTGGTNMFTGSTAFGSNASTNPWNFNWSGTPQVNQMIGSRNLGSGIYSEPTMTPGLTSSLSQFLGSQVGQGMPANPLLQGLLNFYTGGGPSNIPGANTLQSIAQGGLNVLPAWQAMQQAQQQNIGQNAANLAGQFASEGLGTSSPFGTAMSNYFQGANAQQNALLGNMTLQGILQGQIPAAQGLLGGAGQFGQFGQTLTPQENPLLPYMQQMGLTFAPMYQTKKGGGILGGLSGLLGPALGAAGGIGSDIAQGLAGGGGITDVISSLAGGGAASGALSSLLSALMAI